MMNDFQSTSTSAARKLGVYAIGALSILATAANADPPTFPNDMFIQAAPTEEHYKLRVTWRDALDEDAYQLLANVSSTPGPVFGPNADAGWELVTNLPANATEFTDDTLFGQSYAICALKGLEMTCFGPSSYAIPTYPPEPAQVESLQVSLIATNSLRVQWTQSSNTQYSRAEIARGGSILSSVVNDADQTVRFGQLQPNVLYTLKICVRNQEQTVADETCRSTQARTLPLAPLAVRSIGVNQSDPNPRQRTITFGYDNQPDYQVIGLMVRLIQDDHIIADNVIYPDLGDRTYQYTFSNLEPFTSYEAWVVPYNRSGVGTSAGIGFTTPTEVNVTVHPLSGDSVMLQWRAAAIGRYGIERRNGSTWTEIGHVDVRQAPRGPRVVVQGLSGPQELRVTWKLAYLRTQSTAVTATPFSAGTPELVLVRGRPTFFGNPPRYGTHFTVTFRTTVGGLAEYVLQRKSTTDWLTVVSTGVRFTAVDNTLYTLSYDTTGLLPEYRVCKRSLLNLGGNLLLCGASSSFASDGLTRLE
jgi:hypothetical protein